MSDFETVARPYSKAVFELAQEQQDLQYWSDLLQLASSVASDTDFATLAASPSVADADLADLCLSVMDAAQSGLEINPQANNLIALLAENGRLLAIPEIADGYEAYKQEAEGTVEVHVASARKLTVKQENAIVKSMQERLGKQVTITSEIDQSLIAGAVIHAGDLVIDGSARGQLDKLKSQLNK
jgi:F-type H+-transporting ATPase subunit delta